MKSRAWRLPLFLLCVCIFIAGCANGSTFQGSKITNANSIELTYTLLDREETSSMLLSAGDTLDVMIQNESGNIDLAIGIEGQEAVYTGNALADETFSLDIPYDGAYNIRVTGHDAAGTVSFTRITPATDPTEDPIDPTALREAYQFALQQIAFEHIYPDGTDIGFDAEVGFIEENFFALYDVDADGTEELIVRFLTAQEEEMRETVYRYDAKTDSVRAILTASPSVTFYSNAVVKELWAYGSGLAAAEYAPYNLYRYDPDSGQYSLFAEVNMWSKSVDTVNYKGEPYPDEIDTENAGTVFIVTWDGKTETISRSEYEAWLAEQMGTAFELTIPYQPLDEPNIKEVNDPSQGE